MGRAWEGMGESGERMENVARRWVGTASLENKGRPAGRRARPPARKAVSFFLPGGEKEGEVGFFFEGARPATGLFFFFRHPLLSLPSLTLRDRTPMRVKSVADRTTGTPVT